MFNLSVCHPSIPYPSLWHHRAGERARLHGPGLETAHVHRRCGHHRVLRGLPRGHRRGVGEVARGQHKGSQRASLPSESNHPAFFLYDLSSKWIVQNDDSMITLLLCFAECRTLVNNCQYQVLLPFYKEELGRPAAWWLILLRTGHWILKYACGWQPKTETDNWSLRLPEWGGFI